MGPKHELSGHQYSLFLMMALNVLQEAFSDLEFLFIVPWLFMECFVFMVCFLAKIVIHQ